MDIPPDHVHINVCACLKGHDFDFRRENKDMPRIKWQHGCPRMQLWGLGFINTRQANLISVVVTNFNNEKYIVPCLRSLSRQTYQAFELIVVDDGSTDGSVQRIKAWCQGHQTNLKYPVQIVRLEKNRGYAYAVNVGLKKARGQYIAMQDGDDLSHPRRFAKQVKFLQHNTAVDMVGSAYAAFKTGHFNHQVRPNWIRYGQDIQDAYAKGIHCVCHGSILFRADIYDRLGGLPTKPEGVEDFAFIAKCAKHGVRIENLANVLYYYRLHAHQRSRKYRHNNLLLNAMNPPFGSLL